MWSSHRKLWGILFVMVINTIFLVLILGYNKRNVTTYHAESLINNGQDRVTEIYSVEDYLAFAESVTEENDYEYSEVVLYKDLDFSGYEDFPVIGAMDNEDENLSFRGTFDGNGHVISGIHIDRPGETVALFAKLDGVVKNLRIENSSFHGGLCGAIAAENYEGAILNCYVDAQVAGYIGGTIAGQNYNGVISNCVASSEIAGENLYGKISHCYFTGQENIEDLNRNLYHISGSYGDASFCRWEVSEDGILSREKMDLLETLTARLTIEGYEIKLNGYYSENDAKWYFALPAAYGDDELYIEATTSKGGFESFKRNAGEEAILFTWGDYYYPIGFLVAENIDTFYVTLGNNKNLEYVHANKTERVPGRMMIIDPDGKVSYETISGFYGHGNDSWAAKKKSYNLKFASNVDLLGMGENEDFVLLAGYRKNSLMSYGVTAELTEEVGFEYAPEFRFVNLYVDGEYAGVYFLTEKIEIDQNRLDITNVYEETKKVNTKRLDTFEKQVWSNEETLERRHYYDVEVNPEDITGGYLLELDIADYEEYESRFTTKGKKNKIVLKRAVYSSEEQVNYIADFWQDFESALVSETGYNEKGKRYTEYIDLESFAMQWLMYELSMEDSMYSSIYYYKESDVSGDGLLHACYPWDMERSYVMSAQVEEFGSVNKRGEYWASFYRHEDFREEVSKVWMEKFIPALELMVAEEAIETESGLKNLSWYENHLIDISRLENSRWASSNMIEKCEIIREVFTIRKGVLTTEFQRQ